MRYHISEMSSPLRLLLPIVLSVLMVPSPAFAGLGDSADSIRVDQVSMKARFTTISARSYTVYELTSPLGTVVREYVSAGGSIFAVSWRGAFVPDMHQLLAKRFEMYSLELKKQNTQALGHSVLRISVPGLVVENFGHMRAYAGRAYDRSLLPLGLSIDEIR